MDESKESFPQMIVDDKATAEQRRVLEGFWQAAETFPASQLGAALTFAELHPTATTDVLPLVDEPAKFSTVFELWKQIIATRAYELVHFDETTEDVIADNPSIQVELAKRASANNIQKETIRKNIIRERFVIFAGRLATHAANKDNGVPLGQTG